MVDIKAVAKKVAKIAAEGCALFIEKSRLGRTDANAKYIEKLLASVRSGEATLEHVTDAINILVSEQTTQAGGKLLEKRTDLLRQAAILARVDFLLAEYEVHQDYEVLVDDVKDLLSSDFRRGLKGGGINVEGVSKSVNNTLETVLLGKFIKA